MRGVELSEGMDLGAAERERERDVGGEEEGLGFIAC